MTEKEGRTARQRHRTISRVIWQSAGLEIDTAYSLSLSSILFFSLLPPRALKLRLSFGHFSPGAKRKNEEHERVDGVDDVFIVTVSPFRFSQSTF